MKSLAFVLGIFISLSISALPSYAMGGGMAGGMSGGMGGGGMMGNWGSGLFDWFQKSRSGSANANLPGEQRNQMEKLDQKHEEDSAYLKYQIQMKEKQLDALLKASDSDPDKVSALQRDIRELRAEADQEQRNHDLEAGKMNAVYRSGNSQGPSSYGSSGRSGRSGMRYGRGMGGFGRGR